MIKKYAYLIMIILSSSFHLQAMKKPEEIITVKRRSIPLGDYFKEISCFYLKKEKQINEALEKQNLTAIKNIIQEVVTIGIHLKDKKLIKRNEVCIVEITKILNHLSSYKEKPSKQTMRPSRCCLNSHRALACMCCFTTVFTPLFLLIAVTVAITIYLTPQCQAKLASSVGKFACTFIQVVIIILEASVTPLLCTGVHRTSKKIGTYLAKKSTKYKHDKFYTNCIELLQNKIKQLRESNTEMKQNLNLNEDTKDSLVLEII